MKGALVLLLILALLRGADCNFISCSEIDNSLNQVKSQLVEYEVELKEAKGNVSEAISAWKIISSSDIKTFIKSSSGIIVLKGCAPIISFVAAYGLSGAGGLIATMAGHGAGVALLTAAIPFCAVSLPVGFWYVFDAINIIAKYGKAVNEEKRVQAAVDNLINTREHLRSKKLDCK